MGIRCFWIEPTDRVALWLRRYVDSGQEKCPVNGYHTAMKRIDDAAAILTDDGCLDVRPERPPVDDPRWPERCECGYCFQLEDHFQVFQDRLYDNGVPLREQPVGAMYDAYWMPGEPGPDDKHLVVILPGRHEWCVDSPASNGPGWTRTGKVPLITATPSIVVPGWHGHLVNGELVPC